MSITAQDKKRAEELYPYDGEMEYVSLSDTKREGYITCCADKNQEMGRIFVFISMNLDKIDIREALRQGDFDKLYQLYNQQKQ